MPPRPASTYVSAMADRPLRFEHHRWLGDKRTQIVYDLDDGGVEQAIVDDIVANEVGLVFGPDTLAEARNRGYRPWSGYGGETSDG